MTKIIRFESTSKKSTSSEKAPFSFPDSVQSDLFGYLKPHQKATLRPYLRIVKRPYQEKLCISLLDYLEGHELEPLTEPILRQLQNRIIQECDLHPLTTRQPKSIGTAIRQFLAGLQNPSTLNSQL